MINNTRLRKLIGWFSFWLPWILVLLLGEFPQSISITFYSHAAPAFIIILGAASVLLLAYSGYDKRDDILNTIAALAGFGILLFPCWNSGIDVAGIFQIPVLISNTLHMICAVVFFVILSINSLWLFTKGSIKPTKHKKIRNIIFRICGVGMLLSFGILLLPAFPIRIWLVETIALFFFSISWLTKANCYRILAAEPKIKLKK